MPSSRSAAVAAHGTPLRRPGAEPRAPPRCLFEPPAPEAPPAPADAIARFRVARAHGRDGRPFPGDAVARDDRGRRHRHQRQDLDRAAAGAGVDAARTRRGSIGTLGAGLYGASCRRRSPRRLVLQCMRLLAQLRDEGAQAVAMEVSLARARPGSRRWRAFRCRRVHQPHPRPPRLPRRHGERTARPRRACSRGRSCARR